MRRTLLWICLCLCCFQSAFASYSGLPETHAFDGVSHTLHESGLGYALYYRADEFTIAPLNSADRFLPGGYDGTHAYIDISRTDDAPKTASLRIFSDMKATLAHVFGPMAVEGCVVETYGVAAASEDGQLIKIYVVDALNGGSLVIDMRMPESAQKDLSPAYAALLKRFLPMPSLMLYDPTE